jgi:hypothetical protein
LALPAVVVGTKLRSDHHASEIIFYTYGQKLQLDFSPETLVQRPIAHENTLNR